MAKQMFMVCRTLQAASLLLLMLVLHEVTGSSQGQLELYQTNGPGGGIAFGLAIHPQNPDIIYVSGYKTIDGGRHWYRTNLGAGLDVLGIRDMAIDPDDPETLYATNTNTYSVYKTVDGGQFWTVILTLPEGNHPYAIAIDPQNTQTVYVGTSEGQLFKSEDGGGTWVDLLVDSGLDIIINKIEINPVDTDEIYLGSGSWYDLSGLGRIFNCPVNKGIYRSQDGGLTWEHLDNQFREALVSDIDIAPSNPNVIYAVAQENLYNCTHTWENQTTSLYKSVDGGDTWTKIRGTIPGQFVARFDMNHVAIDPTDENIVYTAISEAVLKSTDGGQTWTTITYPNVEPFLYTHAIEVAPSDPNIVVMMGYYRPFLKSEDGGMTWDVLVDGLIFSMISILRISPVNHDHVVAANIDGTINVTLDGGNNWERHFFGMKIQYPYGMAFHPYNYDTILVGVSCGHSYTGLDGCGIEDESGIWVTKDGGRTWVKRYEGLLGDQTHFETCDPTYENCALPVYDVQIDPENPNTIYAATNANGIFKSEDGGQTWREINDGIPKEFGYVFNTEVTPEECEAQGFPAYCYHYASWTSMRLAINPFNHKEIWYTSLSGVWKSGDGGESWSWVSDVFKGIHVHHIAFDPEDPRIIYLGAHRSAITETGNEIDSSHGLFISRDGGMTWSQVGSDGPGEGYSVRAIAVDHRNPNNVFVATLEGQLFVSYDKGNTWTRAVFSSETGVDLPQIDWVEISHDGVIYAGTRGAGVWRGVIDAGPVNAPPNLPFNQVPPDGATNVSLTPTLQSSGFSDPDPGDTHQASQWQIRIDGGTYASSVWDSGLDTDNKTNIIVPEGFLNHNTKYWWHVRYQDSQGSWSAWSSETSFITGEIPVFRVSTGGNVHGKRFYCGLPSGCFNVGQGADLAERIEVTETAELGDVVEIDPQNPGRYRKARGPYSTLAAGVIVAGSGFVLANLPKELKLMELFNDVQPPKPLLPSLLPNLNTSLIPKWSVASLARAQGQGTLKQPEMRVSVAQLLKWKRPSMPGRSLLALMGRVKVKATTENGPIQPGDLLVSASIPGYVMRCPDPQECDGAIIGKALEPLDQGTGLILMLVMR